jgi:RNA polymerase sigma factor (sigma-70 family)
VAPSAPRGATLGPMGGMGKGEADELRGVYRRHVDAVYAFFAYSVTRPHAEDLTASTFEKVMRAWSSYDARRAGERTWILAIARNQLTDHYRRQSHREHVSTDEHPGLLTSLAELRNSDEVIDAESLRTWLAPLPDRERMVLAMRFAADLTAEEIAQAMDLTVANVHQIMSRSLRKLRELSEEGQPGRV